MIINKDLYKCKKCKKLYDFDTSKPYSKRCPVCGIEMEFYSNNDCDTELAEKVRNMPPYDPTRDPKSPFYVPRVECPYCHSSNTKKISGLSKAGSVAMWGVLAAGKVSKQWHCNSCGSDF